MHSKLVSRIGSWRWGAFAILLTLVIGVLFIGRTISNTYWNLLGRLQISVGILTLPAFWGLALRRRILSRLFWRFLFFVNAVLLVLWLIFGKRHDLPLRWCITIHVINAMILIPFWVGLLIYAFGSKHIWEHGNHRLGIPPVVYHHDRIFRKEDMLRRFTQSLKFPVMILSIFLVLTFGPVVIRNNRIAYPTGCPPEQFETLFNYRRTTIPQLKEYERLFPNHLCALEYSEADVFVDPNDGLHYADPNSPVIWRLSAGLYGRYLIMMETKIVFAEVDPDTGVITSPGSHEEPEFSLWEVLSVTISPKFVLFGHRYASVSRDRIRILTADEWEELVEADGDFSVLGIELKKNRPVPSFERACWNNDQICMTKSKG